MLCNAGLECDLCPGSTSIQIPLCFKCHCQGIDASFIYTAAVIFSCVAVLHILPLALPWRSLCFAVITDNSASDRLQHAAVVNWDLLQPLVTA